MNAIKVKKEKLLTILKENMERHKKIFLDALKGYRKIVIEILDRNITRARGGGKIVTYISLKEPVDQTQDYERVIGMLQMADDIIIELSEADYSRYVLDNWSWSEQFYTTNSGYTTFDRIPRITTLD